MKDIKINAWDLEGNFIGNFKSQTELAKIINSTPQEVSKAMNGVNLSVKGFQVKEMLTEDMPGKIGDLTYIGRPGVPVAKYFNGRLICVYNSILEASQKTSLPHGNIHSSISRGIKVRGFNFKSVI